MNDLWKLQSVAEKGLYVKEAFDMIYDDYSGEIMAYEENDMYDILVNVAMEIQAEEDITIKTGGEEFYREDIREMAMKKIVRELTK